MSKERNKFIIKTGCLEVFLEMLGFFSTCFLGLCCDKCIIYKICGGIVSNPLKEIFPAQGTSAPSHPLSFIICTSHLSAKSVFTAIT